MHTVLPQSKGSLVALQASGHLGEDDYRAIVPLLESRIREHGKISLFFEMHNFEGWTPAAFWADAKFDFKHGKELTRVAIVGEKKWHEWMTKLLKPFASAEVKYFEPAERSAALEWVGATVTA